MTLLVKTEANKAMNVSALPVSAVTKSPDAIAGAPVFPVQPFTHNTGVETPGIASGVSCTASFRWVLPFLAHLGSVSKSLLHRRDLLRPPVTAFSLTGGKFPALQLSTATVPLHTGRIQQLPSNGREGEMHNLHKLASKLYCSLIKYDSST